MDCLRCGAKGKRKIKGKGVKLTMGGITYIERPVGGEATRYRREQVPRWEQVQEKGTGTREWERMYERREQVLRRERVTSLRHTENMTIPPY